MWSRDQQHQEQLRARLKGRCSGPASDLLNQNQCWNVIMKSFLCFTFQGRTEGLSCSALHVLASIHYSHEKFEKILYLQKKKKCHICVYICVCVCVCICPFCQDNAPKNYNGSSQNYWKTKNLLKFSVFPKKSQIWLIIALEVQCLRQILCHQLYL